MKLMSKLSAALLALALSGLSASACFVQVLIACPGDTVAEGVTVCTVDANGDPVCATTDAYGIAVLDVQAPGTFSICVAESTLPTGATLKKSCQTVKVQYYGDTGFTDFTLDGPFCSEVQTGLCWMTGGGTIGRGKTPDYSYGGVVYPGCSSRAAGGGNWNVVDHAKGLHFQGKLITVTGCQGVPTSSPRVTLNEILFEGTGTIVGLGGNPTDGQPVTFKAHVVDNKDGGAGSDLLWLQVKDGGGTIVLEIGTEANLAVVTTGNLQIHQSSCP
jgi:hypothetical protein